MVIDQNYLNQHSDINRNCSQYTEISSCKQENICGPTETPPPAAQEQMLTGGQLRAEDLASVVGDLDVGEVLVHRLDDDLLLRRVDDLNGVLFGADLLDVLKTLLYAELVLEIFKDVPHVGDEGFAFRNIFCNHICIYIYIYIYIYCKWLKISRLANLYRGELDIPNSR